MAVPDDFYTVLREPGLLAGMRKPGAETPWHELATMGFRHLVRLARVSPPLDQSPLQLLWDTELQDLVDGGEPDDPKAEAARINDIALDVVGCLRKGEGVIIHCVAGRGRTGTVLGRVLRFLGCPGRDVVEYLDDLHKARGKSGWPESPWQAAMVVS